MSVESSNIQVPSTLADAGTNVRREAQAITGELEALAAQLQPLQDTWNDPGYGAYSYFQGLEQEWNLAALGLFGDGATHPGILGNIAEGLDIAWYNYVTTQETNKKHWVFH